jgi:bifunctional DNase/RNase
MSKTVVPVQVKALIPTNAGVAVFVGNEEKVFVIYVDPSVGSAINMFMSGVSKERPLTHDLMALLLSAVGAKVERVIINDLKNGTYFGRLIITAENELQQRKIIELDARPSDCIAMATQQKAPVYVSREVWEEVEDMTDVLHAMQEQQKQRGTDDDEEGDES